jgi:DNA-binding HxlR family transcriptional regulator
MAPGRDYGHFCPAALALEVVGERWALLIVRDLLGGERRFSDLAASLGAITPKQLTLRLRELEASGIVRREREEGRREVRYSLTPAGRDLGPVIQALLSWGALHAPRPPRPGEHVHASHLVNGVAATLNTLGVTLAQPRAWTIRFEPGGPYVLRFDGARWAGEPGDGDGSVVIDTDPRALASFLMSPIGERRLPSEEIHVDGDAAAVDELRAILAP